MEYLTQFHQRIDQIYTDPSLDIYTRFINLMKVVYNMHEFYMKHYTQIMNSCKNKIDESEKMKEFLHDSYISLERIILEYNNIVVERGYQEDNNRIKKMVETKITTTIDFLERKIANEFRVY